MYRLMKRAFLESVVVYRDVLRLFREGLKEWFEDDREWEETAYYKSAKRTFDRGVPKRVVSYPRLQSCLLPISLRSAVRIPPPRSEVS